MSIQAVFFDVAGTLIDVRGGVGRQYAALAREAGVEADEAALERGFRRAFAASPAMAFPGLAPHEVPAQERAVWRTIVRSTLEEPGLLAVFGDRFDEYFASLYEHFRSASAWEVPPDAVPLLDALRAAGRHAGVVTNFDSRVRDVLAGLGLADRLDSLTVSSEVGAAKPDPAIFRHALAAAGVTAARALHCGDSIEEDVAGARAAGLTAVLLDRAGRHGGQGRPRVRTLTAILELLE